MTIPALLTETVGCTAMFTCVPVGGAGTAVEVVNVYWTESPAVGATDGAVTPLYVSRSCRLFAHVKLTETVHGPAPETDGEATVPQAVNPVVLVATWPAPAAVVGGVHPAGMVTRS
jgi:hypothetical protein